MDLHELNDRLHANKCIPYNEYVSEEQFKELIDWYIMIDLDKDKFAEIVKAVGIETLTERAEYPKMMITALYEYQLREQYKANKLRIEEMQHELARLQESVKAFEKTQIY